MFRRTHFYTVHTLSTLFFEVILHLLDHRDVHLHVHHVAVPPVILETHHQSVWLEATQASSLESNKSTNHLTKNH